MDERPAAAVTEPRIEVGAGAEEPAENPSGRRAAGGGGSLFSVFRFTAVVSAVTILLGLFTNKVVVLFTGAQGVAVLALYRSLTATATAALALSMTPVIVQRVSMTRTLDDARHVLRTAWLLFILQVIALGCVALFGAEDLSRLMFKADGYRYVTEVRVVLILVSGVLGLQLVTALLNGRVRFRQAMAINLISSVLTVIAVYPLLRLGDIGLAMVIGLTCLLAAAIGGWYVWREYGLSASDLRFSWQQWRELRGMPISVALSVRAVVTTATMFALQFTINRTYGISALGLYSAAAMIEAGLMQVLSSAMVPYKLPSLAAMNTQEEKDFLVNRMLVMLLGVSAAAVLALTVLGGVVIPVLFRGDFAPANRFIPILGVSVLAQCIVWCYAIFLQHKGDFRGYLALDSIWAGLLLGGLITCAQREWSLDALLWVYTGSYCLSALVYVTYSMRKYGRGLLDVRLGSIIVFGAIAAGDFFLQSRLIVLQSALLVVSGGSLALYGRLLRQPVPVG
jgi:O-antigen/teichoic acid export membrane protein